MDRNSESLEWGNLAVFGGKPIEFPPKMTSFSMYSSGSNDFGKASEVPMIGLRLGNQKESGGSVFGLGGSNTTISTLPTKRSRASYQNMQNPCCQVEGCNLDLKLAKEYHRRHRICETHSKSPKVIVAGMERRFCQQCSRFHDLSEFDHKKRSCRKRLSDHNARRRRQQPPESIQFNPTRFSSAIYDERQHNMLNGLPVTVSNSTWENANTSIMLRQSWDLLSRPPKAVGFDRTLCFPNDEIPSSISNLHMGSERLSSVRKSCPRVLDQSLHVPTSSSPIAPDHPSAHSLLSSNSWSLNEAESMSMDYLGPGNYNNPMLTRLSEPQQWSLFDTNNSNNIANAEQSGNPFSMNLHNPNTSHLQEYQLFKAPYDSTGFYSPQG